MIIMYRKENEIHKALSKWLIVPSRELTYPLPVGTFEDDFLFPRWDMLVSWRVIIVIVIINSPIFGFIYVSVSVTTDQWGEMVNPRNLQSQWL